MNALRTLNLHPMSMGKVYPLLALSAILSQNVLPFWPWNTVVSTPTSTQKIFTLSNPTIETLEKGAKLTIKTPEDVRGCSSVFVVNLHILHVFLKFHLLTLNRFFGYQLSQYFFLPKLMSSLCRNRISWNVTLSYGFEKLKKKERN